MNTQHLENLFIAIREENLQSLQALLQEDSSCINGRNSSEATLLHAATKWGCKATVQTLLGVEGVDVNKSDQDGNTPLYVAAAWRDEDMIKALLESNPFNYYVKSIPGMTPAKCLYKHSNVTNELKQDIDKLAIIFMMQKMRKGHSSSQVMKDQDKKALAVLQAKKTKSDPIYIKTIFNHPESCAPSTTVQWV